MKTVVSCLFGLLCLTTFGRQVESILSTDQIIIGEQLTLTLVYSGPSGDAVEFPTLSDTVVENVEVLALLKTDTVYDPTDLSQKSITYQYNITSFDSGLYVLPPFSIKVNQEAFQTEPLLLVVQGIQLKDEQSIADIKDVYTMKITWKDYLDRYQKAIFIGLGLIAIIIAIVLFLVYRKPKENEAPPTPSVPPHRIALSRLNQLADDKLWQQDKVKQYHSVLSEIVREYIEGRYKVPALEQTTDEIMQSLKYVDIASENLAHLKELLFLSDMVKFAKEKPLASDNERVLKYAFDFVYQTKPKVAPKTEV